MTGVAVGAAVAVELATKQDLEEHLGKVVRLLRRRPLPFFNPAQKVITASTYNFLDLGGPSSGQILDVLRYVVTGADPFTQTAGNVFPFLASVAPNDSNNEPRFPNLVDGPGAIPNVSSWAPHQLAVHGPHHLILCFKGVAAGTQIEATLQGALYDVADYMAGGD